MSPPAPRQCLKLLTLPLVVFAAVSVGRTFWIRLNLPSSLSQGWNWSGASRDLLFFPPPVLRRSPGRPSQNEIPSTNHNQRARRTRAPAQLLFLSSASLTTCPVLSPVQPFLRHSNLLLLRTFVCTVLPVLRDLAALPCLLQVSVPVTLFREALPGVSAGLSALLA